MTQTARVDEKPIVVKARKPALRGKVHNELSVLEVDRIPEGKQGIGAAPGHGREGGGVVVCRAHLNRLDHYASDRRRRQRFAEPDGLDQARRIPQHGTRETFGAISLRS